MTGKYVRKKMPLDLQPHDENPFTFSGPTSPSTTDGNQSWTSASASNDWPTGNATDRSLDTISTSNFSLGEDEYDRKASKRVRLLFEQIDAVLFENYLGTKDLSSECQEWKTCFPHLRVLGSQVLPPQDNGFQIWPHEPSSSGTGNELTDVTEQDINGAHMMNELTITGHHVDAKLVSTENFNLNKNKIMPTADEVFAEDGQVEDIIAVDYKSVEEKVPAKYPVCSRQKSSSYRATPEAFICESIGAAAFDYLWGEIISWLRQLLIEYSNKVKEPPSVGLHLQSLPIESNSLSQDSARGDSFPLSGRFPDKRFSNPGNIGLGGLDSLLSISSFPIRQKHNSIIDKGEAKLTLLSPLPGLKLNALRLPYAPQFDIKTRDADISSMSLLPGAGHTRNMRPGTSDHLRHSARGVRKGGRLQLHPLALDRAKTPGELTENIVRGTKMPTMSNPTVSQHSRNVLPPIDSAEISSLRTSFNNQKKSSGPTRASSAVQNPYSRISSSERDKNVSNFDGRPSTTHALYRSDTMPTMQKRASTPQGIIRHNTTLAPASSTSSLAVSQNPSQHLTLGVTGSSINQHGQEEGNQLDENLGYAQWGAHHLARKGKHQQYLGPVR